MELVLKIGKKYVVSLGGEKKTYIAATATPNGMVLVNGSEGSLQYISIRETMDLVEEKTLDQVFSH